MTQTAATRQRMATSTQNEAQQTAANVLEEVMEEANVTDLRNGLLPTIERIQENPAIKIVIRKHGKRRAVLMSAATYDTLMHVANLFIQENDRLSPQGKLEAAYERLESSSLHKQPSSVEQGDTSEVSLSAIRGKEVKILIENAQELLRELDFKLGEVNYR